MLVHLRNVLDVQVTENMLGDKKVTVVFVLGICSFLSSVCLFVSHLIEEKELIASLNL